MIILKSISLTIIRFLLKIFYIIPLNKRKVLFIAFDGRQYSCNPKYIFEYLKNQHALGMKSIWVFNKPDQFTFLTDEGAKVVRNKSISYLYHILTSKVIITNASIGSYIPLRNSQKLIETWHGGGAYKKTGRDVQQSSFKDKTLKIISKEITRFISSSRKFTETKSKNHFIPKEKFWEIGMPRNDVLFDVEKEKELRNKVREYYNIDKDTKLVLYAPTLRNDKTDTSSFESLNVEKLLNSLRERFKSEKWIVLFRMHYLLDPSKDIENTINVSEYNDSQELVCASDVLISDYSSIMWDFTFTKRPCFVFAPDAKKYEKERAFFTPIDEWPYPVSFNNSQLKNNIVNFNEEYYYADIERHHKVQGSFETGNATRIVAEHIINWIK